MLNKGPPTSDDSLVLARFVWRLVDEGVIPSRLVPTRVAEVLVRVLPDIHHKITEDVDADNKGPPMTATNVVQREKEYWEAHEKKWGPIRRKNEEETLEPIIDKILEIIRRAQNANI